ncbi:hypothetical protein, partial [Thiolapillus sp.]|uniref:hypothetical protein n=1 Tax=Thiolapillus sp. TaxID=2017437 RepID=UPI003AF5D5C6
LYSQLLSYKLYPAHQEFPSNFSMFFYVNSIGWHFWMDTIYEDLVDRGIDAVSAYDREKHGDSAALHKAMEDAQWHVAYYRTALNMIDEELGALKKPARKKKTTKKRRSAKIQWNQLPPKLTRRPTRIILQGKAMRRSLSGCAGNSPGNLNSTLSQSTQR